MRVLVGESVPHDRVDRKALGAVQQVYPALIPQLNAAGGNVGVDHSLHFDHGGLLEGVQYSEGVFILPEGIKVVTFLETVITSFLHFLSSTQSLLNVHVHVIIMYVCSDVDNAYGIETGLFIEYLFLCEI